jgi:2,3-bisphosphoglycerate-independent phosphoglycerate mutase
MKLQSAAKVNRRICLVVIDGWGLASDFDDGQTGGTDGGKRDAIKDARAETMLHLATTYPSTQLVAHGLDVGLPEGLMGNSEVGHLNLGAGRIVYQDIVRIDQACREGSLERTLLTHLNIDEDDGSVGPVHLVGLVSDGGVHSSLEHVKYMLGVLRRHNITAYLHAITDGRDTAPKSALKYLEPVKNNIATIVGRYYAMDRDRRWERTQLALHALLTDCADQFTDFEDLKRALEDKYAAGETDEFFRPLIKRGSPRISGTVVCFNFRSDRMRQLVSKFRESPQVQRCICMTRYSEDFEQLPVLSPPQSLKNVLSEVVSLHGLQQCHIAGTFFSLIQQLIHRLVD